MASRNRRILFTNAAVFIILEMASLVILGATNKMERFWLQSGFHNLSAHLWETTGYLRHYLNLNEENERLAAENLTLLRMASTTKNAAADVQEAWKPVREHFMLQGANVVTMTSGSQHNYIIIDRGSLDGIRENDGLITSKGVLGVVKSVTRKYSYAISYANKDMVISATPGRQGLVGSLVWDGHSSKESMLKGMPVHYEVTVGDTVYTSGFSSVFPRGIPLGTVTEKKINNGSTASFRVSLFEDFGKIRHLFVVRNLERQEIEELKQTAIGNEER